MKKGVILVISDSLRADHLECYGSEKIHTPNIDKFAKESTLFERAYAASYPTIPNRLDIWTGRYNFPFRGWEPLDPKDVILPEVLGRHGVTSYYVFDSPSPGIRGFSGWYQIRGHHGDRLVTDPTIPIILPAAPHKLKRIEPIKQYLRNRARWFYEKDYIAPRTFAKAIEWLERNYRLEKFFLLVDTWDPHEPFDPPLHYLRLYANLEEDVENIIYPAYGHSDYMSEAELRRVRVLYAGEVTMVDTWFGYLLDAVERFELSESTMIIFTSDHGHLFGEHGLEGKPGGILGRLYEEITRVPLIIRHPEGIASGRRIKAITQPPDIMPTILEFFGIPIPRTVHGRSILPLMTGERESIHKYAFTARFPYSMTVKGKYGYIQARSLDGWAGPPQVFSPVTVTDGHWTLICNPDPNKSELYDLDSDPAQKYNIIENKRDIASLMRQAFIAFMEKMGARKEWIEPFKKETKGLQESLKSNTTLYVIQDARGKFFAYLTTQDARERLSPKMKSRKVKTMKFQTLLKKDPKAFIYLGDQYYWAEELFQKS